ncbi:MAG: hypothetical protein ACOX0A_05375 [Thermoguttaceae bacterium]|jgi:hypothetical protein
MPIGYVLDVPYFSILASPTLSRIRIFHKIKLSATGAVVRYEEEKQVER